MIFVLLSVILSFLAFSCLTNEKKSDFFKSSSSSSEEGMFSEAARTENQSNLHSRSYLPNMKKMKTENFRYIFLESQLNLRGIFRGIFLLLRDNLRYIFVKGLYSIFWHMLGIILKVLSPKVNMVG